MLKVIISKTRSSSLRATLCHVKMLLITHAEGNRVSIAIIPSCDSVIVCVCVCVCVCPHDKTKMTETKIAKLGTGTQTVLHHSHIARMQTNLSTIRYALNSSYRNVMLQSYYLLRS